MNQLGRPRRSREDKLLLARQTAIHQMYKCFLHAGRQMLQVLDDKQVRLPGGLEFLFVGVGQQQRLEIARAEQRDLQVRRSSGDIREQGRYEMALADTGGTVQE